MRVQEPSYDERTADITSSEGYAGRSRLRGGGDSGTGTAADVLEGLAIEVGSALDISSNSLGRES
jgi:hypothetical protein